MGYTDKSIIRWSGISQENHGKDCRDGLMNFETYSDQGFFKKWLRRIFFINPIVRQFNGYVLDIGCGPGMYLEQYSGPVLGIDAHPNNIRICRNKGIEAIEADANRFIRENTFDTVLVSHILEHLDDPECVIQNACRSVKPGGRIILIVPGWEGFQSGLNEEVGHKKFITEDFIDTNMKKNNSRKIKSTWFPPILGGKYKELRVLYEKIR